MNTPPSIQDIIAECHDAGTPEVRVLELMTDHRSIVRYNAMLALGTRMPQDECAVVEALKTAASAISTSKPLVGTMTERMMAAYALHAIDSPTSRRALDQVEAMLPEVELSDLRWNIEHNPIHRHVAPPPDAPPSTPRG